MRNVFHKAAVILVSFLLFSRKIPLFVSYIHTKTQLRCFPCRQRSSDKSSQFSARVQFVAGHHLPVQVKQLSPGASPSASIFNHGFVKQSQNDAGWWGAVFSADQRSTVPTTPLSYPLTSHTGFCISSIKPSFLSCIFPSNSFYAFLKSVCLCPSHSIQNCAQIQRKEKHE